MEYVGITGKINQLRWMPYKSVHLRYIIHGGNGRGVEKEEEEKDREREKERERQTDIFRETERERSCIPVHKLIK